MLMKVQLITRKCCFGISEAEILLASRTGHTSAVAVSVYPDKETAKNTTVTRNARMGKSAHWRKSTEMHQGDVTLKVVR